MKNLLTGGMVDYYLVEVKAPQREGQAPYQAECEDIIQALGMTFDEGCAFKSLWRTAAQRQGNGKPGQEALYDREKLVHYANRLLNQQAEVYSLPLQSSSPFAPKEVKP